MIAKNLLKFKNILLHPDDLVKSLVSFWDNNSRILFAVFSGIVLAAGIFIWYQSIFQSEWTKDKKNQYKNSQSKEVGLKEQELKKVTDEIGRRKNLYEGTIEAEKDIFSSYEVKSEEVPVIPENNSPATNVNSSSQGNVISPRLSM